MAVAGTRDKIEHILFYRANSTIFQHRMIIGSYRMTSYDHRMRKSVVQASLTHRTIDHASGSGALPTGRPDGSYLYERKSRSWGYKLRWPS